MPCFLCKQKNPPYQALIGSRIRFFRKAYPTFEDKSLLCLKCFGKFEKVFQSKSKGSRSITSNISAQSNLTIRTVSTTTNSSSNTVSKDNITIRDKRISSSKENTQDNGSPLLQYNSQTNSTTSKNDTSPLLQYNLESRSSNDSMDSIDRLVRMTTENQSLKDSVRHSRNAETSVARVGAIAAEKSALRRKRAREDETLLRQTQTPTGRRSAVKHVTGDDDDTTTVSSIKSYDLANVGPVVKRRKEPVVHLNQDIMDIYLANTSGG